LSLAKCDYYGIEV
jgi:hypothetical protein